MKAWPVQAAIHARLTNYPALQALVGQRIFDDVAPEGHSPATGGNPAATFPYVTHAESASVPFNTDTSDGADITYAIHVWSRDRGAKQAKQIGGVIYAALHRYALPVEGANVILCDFDDDEFPSVDPDGVTRHGVLRFRILLEDA